jgi:transposase
MHVVFTQCAGREVGKKRVRACRITPDPAGQQAKGVVAVRAFGTLPVDLLALSDRLAAAGSTPVAMESTGEYWTSGLHLLEGTVQVFLVNALHVKRVPGRKTDQAAARWLAQLMRDGVRRASFMPPAGRGIYGMYPAIAASWCRSAAGRSTAGKACWNGPISRWPRWRRP